MTKDGVTGAKSIEFNESNHLISKEDDIVGILETDNVKDLKPLNDTVLIKDTVGGKRLKLLFQGNTISSGGRLFLTGLRGVHSLRIFFLAIKWTVSA